MSHQTIVIANVKQAGRNCVWSAPHVNVTAASLAARVLGVSYMPEMRKPVASERFVLPIISRGAERLLNSCEAARFLGVHPRTLQRMVIRGEISGVRVGRLWRFSPSSLSRWVEERDLAS
jgi:excisionase family DNA binding protein